MIVGIKVISCFSLSWKSGKTAINCRLYYSVNRINVLLWLRPSKCNGWLISSSPYTGLPHERKMNSLKTANVHIEGSPSGMCNKSARSQNPPCNARGILQILTSRLRAELLWLQGHLQLLVQIKVLILFFLILLFNETFKLTLFGIHFVDGNIKVLCCFILYR